MRYTLKDYQADAVAGVLQNLRKARRYYAQERDLTQFTLSAATGAGKTVMAAAVIEALFFGSDEFDVPADPGAVVLWFSDDPSLNEQSRARIQAAASELDGRLRPIPATFNERKFRPGNVYFLNTQKLSKKSRLVRGDVDSETDESIGQGRLDLPRPDMVQATIYDVIRETIADPDLTLYLILDEAHRGMGAKNRDRATIVQRLINGQGTVPAMPIVWGISATVERFENAMKGVEGRTALPSVVVDAVQVQESGLLKDDIVLTIPAESGLFDTTLLRRAVEKLRAASTVWAEYSEQQHLPDPVVPLLVVQVEDKPSAERLAEIVATIRESWPSLPGDAIAHVFGEHTDLEVGDTHVAYIAPERVQDATHVQVLLAKTAISTGWDCPRAEVLVSFRPATDRTHITQLLGRMIRTPLARRIPGNQVLNSVACLLPFFDRSTATQVADMLMRGAATADFDTQESGIGQRVLFNPVDAFPNEAIPAEVWQAFDALPSQSMPRKTAKPVSRLMRLAAELSVDGIREGAVAEALGLMVAALKGREVQHAAEIAKARRDIETMDGEELTASLANGGIIHPATFSVAADWRAIRQSYKEAARLLGPAVAGAFVDASAGTEADEDDLREAHVRLASLALVPAIAYALADEAEALSTAWLAHSRAARSGLPDSRTSIYDEIEAMAATPQRIGLARPQQWQVDTRERDALGEEVELPAYERHLVATAGGTFPVYLNDWERDVLDVELARPSTVAWYRNPSQATKESLAVAYRAGAGDDYRAVRPDFLVFTRRTDGSVVVDIVDPHGTHLADALAKLRGLADFAEEFADEVGRVDAIAKVDGALKVLDLTKPAVRIAVRDEAWQGDAQALYAAKGVDYL